MGQAAIPIALATTALATGASAVQASRAQDQREDAQRIAQRQANLENVRRIRQSVAAARADRANVIASGFAQTGGFDSSSLAGGVASADTQLASNVGFARQTQAANNAINRRNQRANNLAGQANTFGAIAGLPAQLGFDVAGSIERFGEKQPQGTAQGTGTGN